MTQLLVSVRDATEAQSALAGGADWIDVKEPYRGALGFAEYQALRAVAAVVARRAPLSAALGEIGDARPPDLFAALDGYQLAKLGLAGAASIADWPQRWRRVIAALPQPVRPVAVVYADWQTCAAPPPHDIVRQGVAVECAALLIDTYSKDGSTTLDYLAGNELAELLTMAREAGLRTVVAGSLRRCDVSSILPFAPDLIAVRGVVCRGGRGGAVEAALVAEFRCELARNSHPSRGESEHAIGVNKFA